MTRILEISLITLGDPGRLTGGYLYHRRMAEAAPAYSARISFVSFPERPFPLAMLRAWSILERAAGRDVVLVDSIVTSLIAPHLVARTPPVPVAAILHQPPGGIDHAGPRRWAQAALDRLCLSRADALLLASELLRDEVSGWGVDARKIIVVPPGRDVAPPGEVVTEDLRRGREAALLCVANWIPRKCILALLDALAMLPDRSATLHLVGDQRADPRYAARVRSRLGRDDVATRVVVHGAVSSARVHQLYGAADVFVLPSMVEPYGTVLGEAMSEGLPVVGWRAGNLRLLARHGQDGMMVAPGDVEALAGALLGLVQNEERRLRMGDSARRRAAAFPTWNETAARFFSILRSVAAQGA